MSDQLVPETRRLVGLDRRAAEPLDEQAAQPQSAWSRIISAGSRSRGPAGQQAILRVALRAAPASTRDDCR